METRPRRKQGLSQTIMDNHQIFLRKYKNVARMDYDGAKIPD